MGRYKNHIVKLIYILIDVFWGCVAIFIASSHRNATLAFPVTFENLFLQEINPFRFVFLFWILILILFNHAHGLYSTKREMYESVEIWEVIKSIFLSSLATITLIYLAKIEGFPRTVFALSGLFMALFFSLWRVLKRFLVEYLVAHGYNNFNTLIIGAGRVGEALAREIEKNPNLGVRIIGFLDDFKSQDVNSGKWKVLGKLDDFMAIARREFINEVFITIHHDSKVFIKVLAQARELGIAVRVIPQGFELTSGEFLKYNIGFIPVLEYSEMQEHRKQAGKRVFDFVFSAALFLLLLPFYIVIALLIKIDSSGPVLFKSKRFGRGGRIFHMYKFRSMVEDAEHMMNTMQDKNEVDGPIFKIKEDPRVTKIGKLLRRYSLDELPQIFNVVRGDMSLVGPRPFPITQIEKEDFRQLKRLEIRPGITGLWQIRGRSDISFEKLLRWDIWYINNWSLWLDWNILLQTMPVVLKGKGAY